MRVVTLFIIVLGALCALAPSAYADWHREHAHGFANAETKHLEALADPEQVAAASDDAGGWTHLAENMWISVPYTARVHPELTAKAVDLVLARVTKARAADPESDPWNLAWAWATLLHQRHLQLRALGTYDAAWGEAVELLGSERSIQRDPFWGHSAAVALLGASAANKAQAKDLRARSRALLDAAMAAVEDAERKAVMEADWHAAYARAHLARKGKSAAKACVSAGVAALAPHREKASEAVLASLDELATLSNGAKLKVKGADWPTRTLEHKRTGFRMDIPRGPAWHVLNDDPRDLMRFERRTRLGNTLYTVSVKAWPADKEMRAFNGVVVKVADTKAFALEIAKTPEDAFGIADTDQKVPVRKTKLGKGFSDVYLAEYAGTSTRQGKPVRGLVYYARHKKSDHVVRIAVFHALMEPAGDDLLPWLLANFTWKKPK